MYTYVPYQNKCVRFLLRSARLLVTVLLLSAPNQPLAAADHEFTVTPLFISGGRGSDPGDFGIPESVILDSKGQIAVTDKGRMMVHVYSSQTGVALFSVGGLGSSLGHFNRPNGIAVDSQGRIFVVEQRNRRIQILNADYEPLGAFGFTGGADGGFQKPMGITIDSQDNLYVTDESRGDVQVFNRDGDFQWDFAARNPRLRQVESIEIDEVSQRIFVCDEGNSRVNMYDLQGNFLSFFGEQGAGAGEFGNDPNAIRIDGNQRIWVNDQGNQRINVYAADTSFLASFRNSANGMESADGMELSEQHNLLLVADQGHDRVLAFDLGALQLYLEMLELSAPAQDLMELTPHSDASYSGMQNPLWERTLLRLQAHGTGDATRIDTAMARVSSHSDPRGIFVRLTETSLDSGVFRGALRLAETSDAIHTQLAAVVGDTLQAHLPGMPWAMQLPVLPLPLPELTDLSVAPGELLQLHRDPSLHWRFFDPADVRQQDGFEVWFTADDSSLVWSSGEILGAQEAFLLDENILPPDIIRNVHMRVRAEELWSETHSRRIRRNTPPPQVDAFTPTDNSIFAVWPVSLQAHVPEDADAQPLTVDIEYRLPSGKRGVSEVQPLENGWLEATQSSFNVMENETLLWRVVTSDGIESTASPWWRLHRNELEELPAQPTLLAPAPDASVYEEAIQFLWEESFDPDPLQAPTIYLEWRPDRQTGWKREAVDGTTRFRWGDHLEDGSLLWRLVVVDPTGLYQFTLIRQATLKRQWFATLFVQNRGKRSELLKIGMSRGASDAFVPGEDLATPRAVTEPQILSLGADAGSGRDPQQKERIVDIRRPASANIDKQEITYDIQVRGAANEILELGVEELELATGRVLELRDSYQRTLGILTAGNLFPVRLDDQGEYSGVIVVQQVADNEEDEEPIIPTAVAATPGYSFTLHQNHPNPFNPSTAIPFLLSEAGFVHLAVYDVAGRLLRTLVNEPRSAALHHVQWNGTDQAGQPLPSGVYLYKLIAGRSASTKKMLLLK